MFFYSVRFPIFSHNRGCNNPDISIFIYLKIFGSSYKFPLFHIYTISNTAPDCRRHDPLRFPGQPAFYQPFPVDPIRKADTLHLQVHHIVRYASLRKATKFYRSVSTVPHSTAVILTPSVCIPHCLSHNPAQ